MANISSHIIYLGGSVSDEHIDGLNYNAAAEKLTATTNFGASYTTSIPLGGGGGGTPMLKDVLNQGNDADQNAIVNLDTIEFTTSTPVGVRKAAWGANDGTLNLGLSLGSSLLSLPIGMTTVLLGFSEEISPIDKLTVVRVKGSKFGYAKIVPAKADNYVNAEGAIGVAAQQVPSNGKGYVVLNGDILNVDTTGAPYSETWAEGDKLYVSASNAGKLTNIAPTSPNLTIMVGYVKDVHPTKGNIFVNYPRAINIPAPSVSAIDVTYIDTYGQGVANVQDAIDDLRSDISNIGLEAILAVSNTSGAYSILFDTNQGLAFSNGSKFTEGTTDGGLGGARGLAQICSVGYELKWEAGRLYVMEQGGFTIRWVLFQLNNDPSAIDDDSKGYIVGSRWTKDNGTTYICTDATTGSAIWELQSGAVPTLAQVLAAGNSSNNLDIIDIDKLDFNLATTNTAGEGQLVWNDTLGTLDLGLKGGNTTLNVGQQLITRVVNKTTPLVPLTKAGYEVVIVAGATGQRLSVKLAKADNDTNSAGTLGIVCENIAVNQEGYIVSVGQLTNINTTGSLQGETWNDGDLLYLSPTTFGAITNVKPSAPFHEVRVGYVEYAHGVNGKIFVKIDNGYELDELHNVAITTPTKGDTLEYNGSIWVNSGIVYTIELMDVLTVDFYAPYDMKINSVTNIKNSPTTTIQDDGVAYTLTNTILLGSKVTVTVNTAGVVNLNITKA